MIGRAGKVHYLLRVSQEIVKLLSTRCFEPSGLNGIEFAVFVHRAHRANHVEIVTVNKLMPARCLWVPTVNIFVAVVSHRALTIRYFVDPIAGRIHEPARLSEKINPVMILLGRRTRKRK